jgi:tetratricopeptide (TPR) repeat protein
MPRAVSNWVIPASAALCVVLLTACSGVYFNTTFNAEKAYNQALDMRAERLELDPDDTVRVSPEEKTKLVRAITKSSKVLELWPRDPKHAPAAVFRIAESQLLLGEYANAATKYDEFLRNFPNDAKVPLAKSRLARALYEDGKRAPAREALDAALENNPTGEARREALLLQAQMRVDGAFGEETGADGLALYEQLLSEGSFPTPEGRNEVRWRAAQLAYQLGQWDRARGHALRAGEGSVPLRAQFRNRRLANLALLAAGKYSEALAESRELARTRDFRAFRPALGLLQARAWEALGDWDAARRLYRDAARGEPRSAVAGEAWYRVGLHAFDVDAREDSARAAFDSAARARGTPYGDSG